MSEYRSLTCKYTWLEDFRRVALPTDLTVTKLTLQLLRNCTFLTEELGLRDERVFIFGEIPGVPERIWKKLTVSKTSWFEGTPCWEWQKRSRTEGGYGTTFIGKLRDDFPGFPPRSKTSVVHRLIYLIAIGDPGELQIDHLCRNRSCANPVHLEAVTQPENLRRGLSGDLIREIARKQAEQTHCMRGHALEGYNLIVNFDRDGTRHRHCRECQRKTWREFARRKRQERKQNAGS